MKVLLTVFFMLAILATLSVNAATGFEYGNVFESQFAAGDVHVTCFGGGRSGSGTTIANFHCSGESFSPNRWAHFLGPRIDANEVELIATHADGSTRTKTSEYAGRTGATTDRINLWVYTLFQRPLLEMGRNDIQWTLKKNGRVVQQGGFIAEVFDRGSLRCPFATQTSFDAFDCTNSSRVCGTYFNQYGPLCR